jgi:transcriptional regulator GlxA family with amidase domain
MSQEKKFFWNLVCVEGTEVTCSNGTKIYCGHNLEIPTNRADVIIICGGTNIKSNITKKLLGWLRKESRKGLSIGGLCTATQVLATAGLLDGKKCTIHWENRDSFLEDFPEHLLNASVYTVDGNRYTAAGGVASADLMLHLIGKEFGADLANSVADQMIHTAIRTEKDDQRLSIPTRIGVRHPKLAAVLDLMQKSLEEPESPSKLASQVGVSTRQLERLFRRYLNRSPKRYYMELRLQKARNLLLQTNMTVINVALACGFSSPSHFSKCYRNHFSNTPYRERGSTDSDNHSAGL